MFIRAAGTYFDPFNSTSQLGFRKAQTEKHEYIHPFFISAFLIQLQIHNDGQKLTHLQRSGGCTLGEMSCHHLQDLQEIELKAKRHQLY